MLTLPPSVKIYLVVEPVHMHRSYDGLSGAAQEVFEQDPMSGHLFVFVNRTRTQMKALYWDRGGYCVFGKRAKVVVRAGDRDDGDVAARLVGLARRELVLESGRPRAAGARSPPRRRPWWTWGLASWVPRPPVCPSLADVAKSTAVSCTGPRVAG